MTRPAAEPPLPAVEVRAADVMSEAAFGLIAGSEAGLASLYAPEHRYAFSPDQLVNAGVHFMVAWQEGRPVACGGFAPCDGYAELKRMFTRPEARGRGLAAAVIAALEAEARAHGFRLMRLETGEASPEALALYARLGYIRRGPFAAYRENGSSVFMEKPL